MLAHLAPPDGYPSIVAERFRTIEAPVGSLQALCCPATGKSPYRAVRDAPAAISAMRKNFQSLEPEVQGIGWTHAHAKTTETTGIGIDLDHF